MVTFQILDLGGEISLLALLLLRLQFLAEFEHPHNYPSKHS